MSVLLCNEFDFLPKTGRPASFGSPDGPFPFFTSSQEVSRRTDSADCIGPALVFGTGGAASIHYVEGPFSATNDCYVAVPKSGNAVDAKFYYRFLRTNVHLIESGFRGAGLRHVSKKHLEAIPLPKCKGIDRTNVNLILDKADAIRRKREQAVALADDFLCSAYLNIVGLKHPSYKDWEPATIESLSADKRGSIRSGPFGSALLHSEFVDEGIAVLGIDNAVKNKFQWAERRFITDEKYEELRRYRVFPNDVIITIMGTTGRSAVVPDDIPEAITTKHLASITCDLRKVLPEVLSFAIHSDPVVIEQIRSANKGAIMDGLNLGIIRRIKIRKPPLDQQRLFVNLLKKTCAATQKMATPTVDGSELFFSLSQRAFRGEL